MRDRLQTQLFGSYFGSFSAHSYGYELSNDPKSANDPKSVLKLLDFHFGPIVGQPPSFTSPEKNRGNRQGSFQSLYQP